jgi:regulator of extracellular matrix RemA (YlzA/DUF370 family)
LLFSREQDSSSRGGGQETIFNRSLITRARRQTGLIQGTGRTESRIGIAGDGRRGRGVGTADVAQVLRGALQMELLLARFFPAVGQKLGVGLFQGD